MIALLPYSQAPNEAWLDALQALRLPHFTRLLAAASPAGREVQADLAWSTAHEAAHAHLLGWPMCDGAYPWAALETSAQGGAAWVHLCHWEMGQSSAHLADPAALQLSEEHSLALMQRMAPYFLEDGIVLAYCPAKADRWVAHGDVFKGLRSMSLARVMGQDLGGACLQSASQAMPALLRRLQSEMQMLLYQDPVNEQRALSGLPPINALWWSGCGVLGEAFPPPSTRESLQYEYPLEAAALQGDKHAWLTQWQVLDTTVFPAIVAKMDAGIPCQLVLCGRDSWHSLSLAPLSGWRNWSGLPAWARSNPFKRLRHCLLQTPLQTQIHAN